VSSLTEGNPYSPNTTTDEGNVLMKIKRLRTTIRVGHGSTPTLRLPGTANLKVRNDGFGLLEVTGQVSNPYRKPLTADAPIFAITLDRRGRIVGANYPDGFLQSSARLGVRCSRLRDAVPEGAQAGGHPGAGAHPRVSRSASFVPD
jgi:hypothetical protein